MKDFITVMKFTMKDMIKRKSFIISTLIILILIVVGFNVPKLLKSIKGDNTGDKLLIVDSQNIFEGSLETLKESNLGYDIQIENLDYEEIKEKEIENENIESAIIIEPNEQNIKIRYIVKNMNMMETVPEDIVGAINSLYTNLQISKLGLTQEQLQSITPNFEFDLEQTEEEKSKWKCICNDAIIYSIILRNIFLCISSIKFHNNRKNIKNNGNISHINKSKNNSARKNNWYWNNWINANDINSWNCIN